METFLSFFRALLTEKQEKQDRMQDRFFLSDYWAS
jgi:hypothetical protein